MKKALAFYGVLALLFIVLYSCGKDKFTSTPQIKIKSISPSEVTQGNLIQLKAEFTDDEGDVDSIYVVKKYWDGNTVTLADTSIRLYFKNYNLPPKTRTADFNVEFLYRQISPDGRYVTFPNPPNKDTTATIGLVMVDEKGNRSEYKESNKIRLLAN